MVEGYQRLYARKYAPTAYRREVQSVLGLLRKKYGVGGRDEDRDNDEGQKSKVKGQIEPDVDLPPDQPLFQF